MILDNLRLFLLYTYYLGGPRCWLNEISRARSTDLSHSSCIHLWNKLLLSCHTCQSPVGHCN